MKVFLIVVYAAVIAPQDGPRVTTKATVQASMAACEVEAKKVTSRVKAGKVKAFCWPLTQ